jgi:succinate dehydrogenase / fumarate reductase, cytochrome b subunit
MTAPRPRPTAPHLFAYKWGPHMAVSIAHRVMGVGMATVGVAMFVWWLAALASGPDAYASFRYWVVARTDMTWLTYLANLAARIVVIGLSFAFFLHMGNGIRHFFMDMGANYELKGNRMSAIAVFANAAVLTALLWTYIYVGKA